MGIFTERDKQDMRDAAEAIGTLGTGVRWTWFSWIMRKNRTLHEQPEPQLTIPYDWNEA